MESTVQQWLAQRRARKHSGAQTTGLHAKLANLWARVRPDGFRPRYGDENLIDRIATSPAAQTTPVLQQALRSCSSSQRQAATALIVQHFDSRASAGFFVDAKSVLQRQPAADPRLGHWLGVASAEMQEATQAGIRIYGDRSARLRPGFPWHAPDQMGRDDLLFAVRPHRFAFAPRMALAVCDSTTTADEFRLLLEDWMVAAQRAPGLPFCSNLVVSQRLFAATWAFAYLAAAPEPAAGLACSFALLKLIGQDIDYLMPRLGSSYCNNHLLLDRFTAWFTALFYAELSAAASDIDQLEAIWLKELFGQTYEDGGSFEHSLYYHGLATEMAAGYMLLAKANRIALPDRVLVRIEKMLRMQAELCGPDVDLPDIGDRSDDPIFPLDSTGGEAAGAFREIYRALFAPDMLPVDQGHPCVERAFWLLGGRLATSEQPGQELRFTDYPDSGIVMFLQDADRTRCTFRTGPHPGLHYMPGHMHSDVLSVTLTYRGAPILVDPGTCSYRFRAEAGGSNVREYFAGPRAHNGFVIRDHDPLGPMTGDFRSHAAVPSLREVRRATGTDLAFVEAAMGMLPHSRTISRGVIHIRDIGFIVYNAVEPAFDSGDVALSFQFAPECAVNHIADGELTVQRGDIALAFAYSHGLGGAKVVAGCESPLNGWVSPRYGERVAAPQLMFNMAGGCRLSSMAVLQQDGAKRIAIAGEQPTPSARCFRIDSNDFCDYVLLNIGPLDAPVAAWGVSFQGRVAWLRIHRDGGCRLRWLDGRSCIAPRHGACYEYDEFLTDFSV